MRLLAATAFAALAIAPAFAADPVIDKIEAKLFLTSTATLSDNVADGSGVSLWNTIIGEGGSGPANDTLVIVTVAADPDSYIDVPLSVVVDGGDGKNLVTRHVEGLLVGQSGKVSFGVYVEDSTCNALTVKAKIGKSEKTTTIPFACGE